MPEAAMNEDHGIPSCQDDVGTTGKRSHVGPVTETPSVESLPDRNLDLGILASDTRHHPAARRLIDDVGHGSGLRQFELDRFVLRKMHDTRLHRPRHLRHHRNDDRVSELLVCPSVGYRDPEGIRIAHQACALSRG